jgi:hypothetical protein
METTLLEGEKYPQPLPSKNPSLEICRKYHSCENMFFSMENLLEKPSVRNYIKKGSNILPLMAVGPCTFFSVFAKNERI